MEEFIINSNVFDVEFDEEGSITALIVHIDKIHLKLKVVGNTEADRRTATALLVWLAKNAEEIAILLEKYGSRFEGKIDINIAPLSTMVEAIGDKFPHKGFTLEEFKAGVVQNGVIFSLAAPNEVYLVVRDDLEKEYIRQNNSMERTAFESAVSGLLSLACGLNGKTAISSDFSVERIPLTPKIPSHELALALIDAKRNNLRLLRFR